MWDEEGNLFSHEDLDVYQAGLQLVAWLESMTTEFACSADLLSKLDKATTAIVLNIAEGNGRFTGTDQAKFFGIDTNRPSSRHHLWIWLQPTDLLMFPAWIKAASC